MKDSVLENECLILVISQNISENHEKGVQFREQNAMQNVISATVSLNSEHFY